MIGSCKLRTATYVTPFGATRHFQVLWQIFVFLAPIAAFFVLDGGILLYSVPRD